MTADAGAIFFINVPAGNFTPTVVPPAGYTCTVSPSGASDAITGTVYDNVAFTVVEFNCTM